MIQVTLQFATLSAALKALREIPESTLEGALTDITPAEEVPVSDPKPAKKTALKVVSEPAVVPAPATVTPEALPLPAVAAPVSYPELQKAVLLLAGRNRDAAQAIASELGVRSFKELDAAQYGAALEAVNARIAQLGAMQ